jgi:hypothetical protein
MSKFKGTKGDWHLSETEIDENGYQVQHLGGKDTGIATIFIESHAFDEDGEGEANARLIATSKEMLSIFEKLDAAVRLVKLIGEPINPDMILMNTEYIIKKATEEE